LSIRNSQFNHQKIKDHLIFWEENYLILRLNFNKTFKRRKAMNKSTENRREFLQRASILAIAMPLMVNCKSVSAEDSNTLSLIKQNAVAPTNEWSGAFDAPANVSWKTALSKDSDKGEKMIISGTIFESDGKTPAPNVLIYLYHTDTEGYYGRNGEHRHGRFRGWMLTDTKGRYEFHTIKPAPYPGRSFAAHIHTTVTTKNLKEDWIDNYLFEGDKLISERERREAGKKGGFNPILTLEQGENGIWMAKRDIKLWRA
jgi:protocatechuate 3,4-dioxygenase beta subunit